MARKVFISFLGTTNYVNCYYSFDDGTKSQPVRFVQEAIISRICRDWESKDIIFIFCTTKDENGVDGSKELNWVDNGQKKAEDDIEKIGLEHRLNDLKKNNNLKAQIKDVNIESGFSVKEVWDIFETVYGKLEPLDEVYFDVTHAFRSIPMFSIVLFNYSKFILGTSLKAIYYGAFEKLGQAYNVKKSIPLEKRIAPILNLTNIALLQEYNQIASELKYFGKVKSLSEFINQTNSESLEQPIRNLADSISKLEKYINTIDLYNLKKGKFITGFSNSYKHLKNKKVFPNPIEKILEELNKLLFGFENTDSFKNIEAAINWTFKYDMLMQAYPLAEEYIILRVADIFIHLKPTGLKNKKYREFIGGILGAPENDFTIRRWEGIVLKYSELANRIAEESIITDIRPYYDQVRTLRNALAHGNGEITYEVFKNGKSKIDDCIKIIDGSYSNAEKPKNNLFINFSNHPSSAWSEAQVKAAQEYGSIIDLPFPAIDETIDEDGIDSLTDNYLGQIKKLSGGEPCTVHIMGEMTFTYALVNKLKEAGYTCVASTSKRDVEISPDGSKQVRFNFCRFRKY